MNLSSWLDSPVFLVLFKWTCLLALAWMVHGVLRHRHARWRLILWRGVLCFGLILPLTQWVQVPGLKIPIALADPAGVQLSEPPSPAATNPAQAPSVAQTIKAQITARPTSLNENRLRLQSPPPSIPGNAIILTIWALGCVFGIMRLVGLNRQLSRLQKESLPPAPDLRRLASQIQLRLKVQQPVAVLISDNVTSPFVCGLRRPTIILPRALAEQLSLGEVSALLSHEMAHVRQHDLVWCVAWRGLKVAWWFHPLVWRIPAAHTLACEQEADGFASGQLAEHGSYAQMLARLALRVLALPAVETQLTLNGGSQIARRLRHLGSHGADAWNWKYSAAAVGLVGLLFLLTAGCQCLKSTAARPNTPMKIEFQKVPVVIQDEDGKPIAGAAIVPHGFRVKGLHGADAYGWKTNLFGAPEEAITDANGRALVKYPVNSIPEEKEVTGALIFNVSHPEFASKFIQSYAVDSPEAPIQLTRGIHLEVSGYYGADHQPVTDLVPNLTEGVGPKDWQKKDDGHWTYDKLTPGGHLLELMGRLPSGDIVYGDTTAFTAERGKPCQLALEMKPGIRLEGRLDDSVPRPVKNGRVMMDVRPKEYPALDVLEDYYAADEKCGGRHFWHSYRAIADDGTFAFESVPPGTADIVVLGDGFASKTVGKLHNRVNGVLSTNCPVLAIPQAFPLAAPVTKIEIATEPAATLEFTATTQSGQPIAGVGVGLYPAAFRMSGPFGWLKNSSEEPYREIAHLPDPVFSGQTDKTGRLVLPNLPAETRGVEVWHKQYQVPLQDVHGWRDRHVRTSFSPGMTNELNMTMEPIGADFIGR